MELGGNGRHGHRDDGLVQGAEEDGQHQRSEDAAYSRDRWSGRLGQMMFGLIHDKTFERGPQVQMARGNARYDSRLFNSLVRKSYVIFGNGPTACFGVDEVIEFTLGNALAKTIRLRKRVQHRGHPPGKSLGLPHPAQANRRIALQQLHPPLAVHLEQDAIQGAHVAGCQVQALGARRRHDVRRVPEQEQAPVLHRFHHETAQRRDAFFDRGAGHQLLGQFVGQAGFQLVPETLVRPFIQGFFHRHLQVIPAAGRRAHAAQRKATRVFGIHQLGVNRRGIGENAQPAKGVDPLENFQGFSRDRLARYAVETIATGDVVTLQAKGFALMLESEPGSITFQIMRLHVARFVQGGGAGGGTGRHQVAGDFGLTVDHDRLAAGQRLEIDMGESTVQGQFETVMHQTFSIHALADARFAQQVDHALFQHPGANATLHVIGGLALKDQRLDPGVVQQLA
ncbi:hypothetical protein BHE74_00034848 [Ensete ventricosum]|nr:hypothetical protein BHE74_00034848 [Ensete ventricosum]